MTEDESPSGEFLIRMPPELHQELKERAAKAGISMNQFVINTLKERFDMTVVPLKIIRGQGSLWLGVLRKEPFFKEEE